MEHSEISNVDFLLQNINTNIISDSGTLESQNEDDTNVSIEEEIQDRIRQIKRLRAVSKRKITLYVKQLVEIIAQNELELVAPLMEEIRLRASEVKDYDAKLEAIISESKSISEAYVLLEKEMKDSAEFHLNHMKIMSKFIPYEVSGSRRVSNCSQNAESEQQNSDIHSMLKLLTNKQEVKIPPLKCKSFSAETDRLQFRSFILSFENIIGCRRDLTDAAKLQYLKSHLTGMAQKDIDHLPNIDSNYQIALGILKDLYLDKPFIIDSLFHIIYKAPNLDSKNLELIRTFMSELRANLHELKEFDVDLLEEDSAGSKFLSHIVVDKLPRNFLREYKLGYKEEYPSLRNILDSYHLILKSMEKFGENKTFSSSSSPNFKRNSLKTNSNKTSIYHSSFQKKQNKDANSRYFSNSKNSISERKCKLCDERHSMSNCTKYPDSTSRRNRCDEINICSSCSSQKHLKSKCPAKKYGLNYPCVKCKSTSHITPLCHNKGESPGKMYHGHKEVNLVSNKSDSAVNIAEENDINLLNDLCINIGASASQNILPTAALKIKRGDQNKKFRFMLDGGSQGTYCSMNVLKKLGIKLQSLPSQNITVQTFLGEQKRLMYSLNLNMNLCCNSYFTIPVLVDPKMKIEFKIDGIKGALANIIQEGYQIADQFYQEESCEDIVSNIDIILGNDALYRIQHFEVIKCLNGSLYSTCHGNIPFGPVESFLKPSQINELKAQVKNSKEDQS